MRAKAKLIASLIKRIEVRLPINNTGTTIESLEQDALTQQTGGFHIEDIKLAAIIELSIYKLSVVVNQLALVLEVISKDIQPSTTTDAYVPLDVLQSQLFIIRLLSACLQYHWNWYKKRTIKLSEETNVTEEALAAAAATGAYSESIPNQPKEDPSFDPPPLDAVLVSFLLNLMGRFLNQFHVIEERSDQLLMSTSEHTNDTVVNASKVDTQTMDYIREVYSASGKILRYISSSNWNSFYMKIKNAINILVAANENSELNPPEIRILAFANLNASKLQTVLTEFSPYFLNMKIQGKLLFAKMLRATIWKWIETRPAEFAEICVSNKKNLAGSEILFDMCNIAADSSRKKAVLWPLQTILLTLSPDLLIQAFLDDRGLQNRRTGFPRQLRKALESVRTQEIAATCYVDLCKAASFVSPNDDTILRHIAEDVEDVLREKVWDFSRPSAIDSLSSSLGYTISQQTLASDYLLAQLQLNSSRAIYTLIPSLLDDDAPTVFRQAFVNACLNIASEEHPLSWHTTLNSLYGAICTPLRRILIQTVKIELAVRSEISSMTSGSRKTINSDKRLQNTTSLLQAMLKLFRMDPCSVLMGTDEKVRVEENTLVMTSIANLMKHQDRRMRQAAVDCLTQLHDPSTIIHWGPSNSIMSTFWKISSQVVSSIARQILDNTRQNEELMNALFDLLSNTLDARNSFLIDVSESCVVHDLYDSHERHQAMVTLEVALLVSLCSSIPDICSKSVKCLGYICKESKIVDGDSIFGDSSSRSSQSTYAYNYNIEIYERLCSEEPMAKGGLRKQLFVGRKAQQKRLRRYLRLMTVPTPGNMLAWEEVWKRWRILTQVVSRYGIDTLKDTSDTATIYSTSSSVKKIGGLVRHDKLRVTSVRTAGSTMSTMLPSPVPVSRVEIDDEKQTEWQNYTGFLAALGGCRLATDADDENIHEDGSRKSKSASSDRIGSPTTKSALLAEKFITEMVELLTSENVVIREAVKDTLGNDLSPALYATLFRQIEAIMKNCFSSNGEVLCNSTNTLFVEQSVLVLKMVLDRLVNANDCLVSVDFSTIVLYFINYINRLPHNNYTTMRTMIMMCHLTESLMSKMDQIIIRDDVRVKNRLLEIIIEWTSSFNPSSTTEINNIQNKEVQRDLDQICLKAIVALLRKLPLQISEQSRDTDRAMSKSRLFQKYFTFFIQLLERCHRYEAENSQPLSGRGLHTSTLLSKTTDTYWGPLKESAVNAISNLLNANVEVGLRSTLAMGYHEDPKMRSAFMQVLANILNAGAQFDTLADTIVNDRYEKLVELLVESDMDLALSICDVCPAVDAPNVTEVLLNVFESKNKILPLLKAIVEREVSSADQESTLFRGTNMATRMLSTFARNTCADYVRMTLQSAMESINALSDIQLTWEMDPLKEALPENLLKNKQNVCRVTEILMDAICNSIPNAPT
ncbi:hypothetical protein G6F57_010255 [Rhizopus arrhizus]|nr:hypothetical protein G6F57_010255 [Rhizopus arrhizus]